MSGETSNNGKEIEKDESSIENETERAKTNEDIRNNNNNNRAKEPFSSIPLHLEAIPESHKRMMTGDDWYLLRVPGNGACLPNAVAAFWFEDPRKGPTLRRMANQFMLSSWWFWQPMIVLPHTVRIGGSSGHRNRTFTSYDEYKEFLNSEESLYMYSSSSVDNAVLSNTLNIVLYTFTYNWANGSPPSWSFTKPDPILSSYRHFEYNNRYPIDVAVYNSDSSNHYDVLLTSHHPVFKYGTKEMRERRARTILKTPRLKAEILSNYSFHKVGSFQFTEA